MTSHASALTHESTGLLSVVRSPVARMVWGYLRRHLKRLAGTVALSFASSGCEAIKMGAILAFIGVASQKQLIPFLGGLDPSLTVGVLVGAAVVQASLDLTRRHLAAKVQRDFTEAIRGDVTDALLHRPLQWFTDHPSGESTYLLNGQVNRFSTLVPMATDGIATIFQGLAVLALCLMVSPALTGVTLVGAIVLWLATWGLNRRIRKLSVEVSDLSTEAAGKIDESVYAIKLVKSCRTEALEKDKYLCVSGRLADRQVSLTDLRNLAGSVVATGFLGLLVILAVTVSDYALLAAFAALVLRLFPCLQKLIEARTSLATMYGHLVAVEGFLAWKLNLKPGIDPNAASPACLDYVTSGFAYGEKMVLWDMWLRCRPFEATAIVGLTGSGKTTLLDILAGLRSAGRVYYPIDSKCAYAPQEPILFSGTVLENVLYANGNGVSFDLMPPTRLNVGTHGTALSGGQRQLVALGRVAESGASIWLLDEPTSSMDAETESRVVDWLLRQRKGRIIIVATHRLRSIQHFDRILVLHGGRIVEDGKHEELVEGDGLYARLWRLQEAER